MSSQTPTLITNLLIAELPRKERIKFLMIGEPVELMVGDILWEIDQPASYVYFPIGGFISLIATVDHHHPLATTLIGNEGMLGATLALGVDEAPMRGIVQGSGTALRMSAARWRRELRDSVNLSAILGRYLCVLIAQLGRSAPCTCFHEIEPRLARWLLMAHDRAHADQFHLTHEMLADMLGVRRSGISVAAGVLQEKQLIKYTRGGITVLDRKGLEGASCSCYLALVADYTKVFGVKVISRLAA